MRKFVVVLAYLLMAVTFPSYQEAGSRDCSFDAALSYTRDNRMYFFKGDKYGVWDDSGDIFGSIGGKSKSVSFVCLCVLIWHFKSTKK